MSVLLFDYDPILYTAGSVGEERSIKVVHKQTGDEYEFSNRTSFWGHWKAKAGGWLAEYNKTLDTPRLPDEFDIIDVQTPEPVENCLHTMKQIIIGTKERAGASAYYGYSGKGEVFRHQLATVKKYKGNRDGMLRPIHLDALKEYLHKHHNCEIVTGIEADDAVSIDSYRGYKAWLKSKSDKDKIITAYVDKDYLQCAGHMLNTNNFDQGICSYDGFGWLELNEKGDVKGRGRMWLYFQTLASDDSDNYAANSASSARWGPKNAFKLLKDCKTDKEAFEAMLKGYRLLYPTQAEITGWRGDKFTVDALYMMQENFNLAKMLKSEDEKPTDVKEVMSRLGVIYA